MRAKIKVLTRLRVVFRTPADLCLMSVSVLLVLHKLAGTNTGKLPSNCVADHGAKKQTCRLWVRPAQRSRTSHSFLKRYLCLAVMTWKCSATDSWFPAHVYDAFSKYLYIRFTIGICFPLRLSSHFLQPRAFHRMSPWIVLVSLVSVVCLGVLTIGIVPYGFFRGQYSVC